MIVPRENVLIEVNGSPKTVMPGKPTYAWDMFFEQLSTNPDFSGNVTVGGVLNIGSTYFIHNLTELNGVISTVGSGKAELVVVGTVTMTSNLSIASNFSVKVWTGGLFSGAYEITFNGSFDAWLNLAFNSDVTVVFSSGSVGRSIPQWWGALPDWDRATGTGTDNSVAFQSAIDSLGKTGSGVYVPAGAYGLASTLNVTNGISIYSDGTVGSVSQKGCKLFCDHIGDGISYSGNNGVTGTEGAEFRMSDIWIYKGPGQNGGAAVRMVSVDSSNTPGWAYFTSVHAVGASQSSAGGGEGLWDYGWYLDGSEVTIGMKNIVFEDCGVTGCSTANQYMYLLNVVECKMESLYIRGASNSFPSGATVGITIDSTQDTNKPAYPSGESSLIRIIDSLILGNLIVGQCSKLYVTGSLVATMLPIATRIGTNISFFGGELANRWSTTVGYTVRIEVKDTISLGNSFADNYRNESLALALDDSFIGAKISCPSISADAVYTMPDTLTSVLFDFTIVNNGAHNITFDLSNPTFNFFRLGNTISNSNITDIIIPKGAMIRVLSAGRSPDGTIFVEHLGGDPITVSGLGDSGLFYNNQKVVRTSALSANLTGRNKEADIFNIDFDSKGSNGVISFNAGSFTVGDVTTIVNGGAVENVLFALQDGHTVTIKPGAAENVIYNGNSGWSLHHQFNVESGITAGTTQTQAGGYALTKSFNEVATVANNGDAITLDIAIAADYISIKNNGANSLQIFPAAGDNFEGVATNASVTILSGVTLYAWAQDTIVWQYSTNALLPNNTTIGSGVAGVDYTLTFNGETSDGVLTWLEDESQFSFDSDVVVVGDLISQAGRIKKKTRVTTTYTILAADHEVFCNTDAGAYTVTLPAGVDSQEYIIRNTGSSGNTLTVAPNGSEHLIGVNSNFSLTDGQDLAVMYDSTDGWY